MILIGIDGEDYADQQLRAKDASSVITSIYIYVNNLAFSYRSDNEWIVKTSLNFSVLLRIRPQPLEGDFCRFHLLITIY